MLEDAISERTMETKISPVSSGDLKDLKKQLAI